MDLSNPEMLRFFTHCVLFWVLKRLGDGGGKGSVVVVDLATNAMRPKYFLQKSGR